MTATNAKQELSAFIKQWTAKKTKLKGNADPDYLTMKCSREFETAIEYCLRQLNKKEAKSRSNRDDFDYPISLLNDIFDDNKTAFEITDIEGLEKAINTILNERERTAITMLYKNGIATKNVATTFDVSPKVITQLKDKALRKLRRPYAQDMIIGARKELLHG